MPIDVHWSDKSDAGNKASIEIDDNNSALGYGLLIHFNLLSLDIRLIKVNFSQFIYIYNVIFQYDRVNLLALACRTLTLA